MKLIGSLALALVLALGLTWIVTGNDFFLYRYFGPKTEQVRHDIYKESQAYNDGMASQLQNMQFKYEQSDPDAKAALAPVILSMLGSYETTRLPSNLQAFVQKVRNDVVTLPRK